MEDPIRIRSQYETGACEFYKRLTPLSSFEKSNGIIHSWNEIEKEEEEDIPRWPRDKKNRIGISLDFVSIRNKRKTKRRHAPPDRR